MWLRFVVIIKLAHLLLQEPLLARVSDWGALGAASSALLLLPHLGHLPHILRALLVHCVHVECVLRSSPPRRRIHARIRTMSSLLDTALASIQLVNVRMEALKVDPLFTTINTHGPVRQLLNVHIVPFSRALPFMAAARCSVVLLSVLLLNIAVNMAATAEFACTAPSMLQSFEFFVRVTQVLVFRFV